MVSAGGVEGELAEDFAGGGVDDGDVEVVDQGGDGLAAVGAADADVEDLSSVCLLYTSRCV